MRRRIFIWIVVGIFLINSVFAISDIAVFQGQYHNETSFINGTFEFTFDIYDAGVGGNLVGSYSKNLTTGTWGQWKAEVPGVSAASNDTSKDYFVEILIEGVPQLPRKRLSHFNYLRKDVDEETSGNILSLGRVGAEEYTFSPQEGQGIMDSYFNFVGPSKGDLIRISPREDFLGFPNATSIFVISENKSYVGMSHFFDPVSNQKGSWVWSDIHDDGNGGFAIINSDNLSVGKLFEVRGIFSNDHLQLGGDDVSVQQGSAGMDFRIYKDTVGTIAFLVDSENSYATTINAPLTVTDTAYFDEAYVNGTKICLEDGTNCQVQNFSFSENDTLQSITDRGATTNKSITIGGVLNFILGGFIQEFSNKFLISKNMEISGNLNVTGDISSNDKLVCLEDGTNCIPSGVSSVQYVSFISTVDGKLNKNDRYLALGTDGGISSSATEMAWIIDRDMTITGILWDSKSNSRTKTSAITLMSGSNKNSLSDTSLSKDIQGVVSGSDLTFNISLSQGDVVAIKYDSGGNGGDVEDLSITLIGVYD